MPASSLLKLENPATNEIFATLAMPEANHLHEMIAASRRAFATWRWTPLAERVAITQRFVEEMLARREEIAREITQQMGKPLKQARAEVDTMAERARHLAAIAAEALADEILPEKPGFFRKIAHEPLGVVVDIAAWNYPLLIAINIVAAALLAGNTVLLKHSALTPLCALRMEEAYRAAGLPQGVMQAVVADRTLGDLLVKSPQVDAVFFTGSVAGGYEVYRNAAAGLKRAGLELGGKDPAYVRADADLAFTAPNVAEGAFYNCGQSCCAVERIYVDRRIYDAFLEAFLAEMNSYKLGDPLADDTYLGPLAQKKQINVLQEQITEAVSRGAKILSGGNPATVNGKGNYFEATVLVNVTNDMKVMQEESFGPIIGIMPVSGDEEALRLMNNSRFGLTASIWSQDEDAVSRLAPHIEAGTVYLNRCDYLDPALPWLGYKESGLGCSLSRYGFEEVTKLKSYHFRKPAGNADKL
ncbi:aldehyde dehydrogenase family protein [bacterium]|nr:aldehyde dehydrogenase family protein [bacterium]